MALILPKVSVHIPNELDAFRRLLIQMNELILELVYLANSDGPRPETLREYSSEDLWTDQSLRERIRHQNVDGLIQVNSALSYIATQLLSGTSPILERRSLIRRHSLLGIGSAILALIRITRSIEVAFSQFSIEDAIVDRMADAGPLPGLDNLPEYTASDWGGKHSIAYWEGKVGERPWYPKLPYFSGRLGFRETEYTISTSMQSLTGGASMAWSLLTITHELLHGHVRNLMSLVFQGDTKLSVEENWATFYRRYSGLLEKKLAAENELESLRAILLTYCCLSYTLGSLTSETSSELRASGGDSRDVVRESAGNLWLLSGERLWEQFAHESRNISEIFVHELDLHYFYGSRLNAYIPLIWRSWAEVPHVGADLRQYILRTLLVIAVKVAGSPYQRFQVSVERLDEIWNTYIRDALDVQLLREAREFLKDEQLRESLFYPFSASLILVDLVDKMFVSRSIRGKLMSDPLVHWVEDETGFEDRLVYRMPDGFCEEEVSSPAAYLLDRMMRRLGASEALHDVEAATARLFLACCSHSDLG